MITSYLLVATVHNEPGMMVRQTYQYMVDLLEA